MRFETCYAQEGTTNVKQEKVDEGFVNLLLSLFIVEESYEHAA